MADAGGSVGSAVLPNTGGGSVGQAMRPSHRRYERLRRRSYTHGVAFMSTPHCCFL